MTIADRLFESIEASLDRRSVLIGTLSAALLLGLAPRIVLAASATFVGHGDSAFYYSVAENLVVGRGFEIDYVGHYLNGLEPIPHYSNDYWMPLTSVIIAASMAVFGKSVFASIFPAMLAALLLALLTYHIARLFSKKRIVAVASLLLVLFAPSIMRYSILTDTTIYFALFAGYSLFLMMRGLTRPALFIPAAGFAALAHLTRQDGILLLPALGTAIALAQDPWSRRARWALIAASIYLTVLSPVIVANLAVYGSPFPPGTLKTLFLTRYEDLFSYSKELSLRSYLDWGAKHIVASKVRMALACCWRILNFLGVLLPILALAGAIEAYLAPEPRRRWKLALPAILLLSCIVMFYTLLATFIPSAGGIVRSITAAAPFIIILGLDVLERRVRSRAIFLVAIAAMAVAFALWGTRSTANLIRWNTYLGTQLEALRSVVESDLRMRGATEAVVMTRNPWEVTLATRLRSVQIPNDSREVICEVAGHYGAEYLLIPTPRKALASLVEGDDGDPRFRKIADVHNSRWQLFRIQCQAISVGSHAANPQGLSG